MELNECHRAFIAEVVAACAEQGVTLLLSAEKEVKEPTDDLGCSGFFVTNPQRMFAVAMKKPVAEWLPVLIHEFGHMEQWMEDPDQFEADDKPIKLFFEWLEHKAELEDGEVRRLANLALSYELDCERRTAWRLHEDPGFGLDYSDYIKRANSYLYLYPMIARHRRWCDQSPPYKVPELVAVMPDKFIGECEDYWNVPEEAQRLILDKCF